MSPEEAAKQEAVVLAVALEQARLELEEAGGVVEVLVRAQVVSALVQGVVAAAVVLGWPTPESQTRSADFCPGHRGSHCWRSGICPPSRLPGAVLRQSLPRPGLP